LLGIKLSNGHVLKYVIASGGLAYDGKGWFWDQPLRRFELLDERLFTTVIKTLTLQPRIGNFKWWNPLGCVRYLRGGGVVNAFGLTNPGIDWWCKNVGPRINSSETAVVGSILGETDELTEMTKRLNDFDLVGLEINASCPNTGGDILQNSDRVISGFETVANASRLPLIGKLSVAHDIGYIVPRIRGIIEAISINSVPWHIVFPNRKSPLAHLGGGGVSGKVAQPFTWKMVEDLVAITDIPVIGPSVWDYEDIGQLSGLGAMAVSFGSVLMWYPWRPTQFVRRHMAEVA